jgi:hypothetical protein
MGRWMLPIVLVAVGLVWIGQGVGMLRGNSFMVDDLRWAAAGVVAVGVGLGLAARRRQRGSAPGG